MGGYKYGGSTEQASWVKNAEADVLRPIDPSPAMDLPQPVIQPINQPSAWDQIKNFDIKGLTTGVTPGGMLRDLGIGLSHGLSNTGTAQQNIGMANLLSRNTLPGMADIGKQQLASQQKEQDFLKANPVNSIAGQLGEQIPQIPLWMGGELAVGAIGKGLTKAFPSLLPIAEKAGNLLPSFVKGGLKDAATYGSVVALTENIQQGGNLQSLLEKEKQIPGVFLGGSALRGVGTLANKGIGVGRGILSPRGIPEAPAGPQIAQQPLPIPQQEPIQSPLATTPQQVNNLPMSGPLDGFQVSPGQRIQGSEIPASSPSPVNPISELPRQQSIADPITATPQQPNIGDPKIVNERQFAQNVRDSQVAPASVKQNTIDNQLTYEPITNRETLDKANALVGADSVKARELFDAPSKGISADDVALGESLIVKAIKDGDTAGANKLIADLAEKLTTAGQVVQAASIFKRLTPEGMLLYAQRVVNSANKDLMERLGSKAKNIELTTEDSKFITDTMSRVQTLGKEVPVVPTSGLAQGEVKSIVDSISKGIELLSDGSKKSSLMATIEELNTALSQPDGLIPPSVSAKVDALQKEILSLAGREKDIAMAQVMKLISEKVPATLTDKFAALQRISLLLNPKTMTRNILGNTVFGAVDNLSNTIATPIDKLTSKLLKTDRTTTLPNLKGQLKSMGEGVKITAQDAKLGIDTYNNKTQYEFSGKKNFTGKDPLNRTLNWLDKKTIVGLKIGDSPFHKAAYDDVIRQQLKLSGSSKPTQAMMEQAQKVADQRTYQDVNAMTEGFKMAQKALNKVSSSMHIGNESFGLGNIVMPFVKTPANILKRAIEYSPIGVTTALKEATNIGKKTFNQKTFVDSIARSVTGTAIIMVGYDLAKKGIITGSGNKDADVASFERGLGKNDYAFKVGDSLYTWDWAQPASMSLAIGADIAIKGKDRKQAENVVTDAIKSGGETLFKQSLLQGVTRFMSGYSPIDNLATSAINAPNQFLPTFGKQISQMMDPIQRSTYSPTSIGTEGNLLKSRIPGLTTSLEPKINTSGDAMQNFQGKNNLFNVFFNPGSATTFKPNEVQKEILRVYDSTGDKTIFPRVAPKSITIKGETIQLTPKEQTTFQQTLGKDTESRIKSVMGVNETKTLSQQEKDDRRAKDFATAVQKAYDDAKIELLKSRATK